MQTDRGEWQGVIKHYKRPTQIKGVYFILTEFEQEMDRFNTEDHSKL